MDKKAETYIKANDHFIIDVNIQSKISFPVTLMINDNGESKPYQLYVTKKRNLQIK